MIIYGTKGITYKVEEGKFYCPSCGSNNPLTYAHKRVRRFFTLYFIPIIPLNVAGEYIECLKCQNTFSLEVLKFDPAQSELVFEAEFHRAIKRVMAMMMIADGEIDPDEIQFIREVFENISGNALSEHELRQEAEAATVDGRSIGECLKEITPSLNDKGKELVITAAFMVAMADGVYRDQEAELLAGLGKCLEMPTRKFEALIGGLSQDREASAA